MARESINERVAGAPHERGDGDRDAQFHRHQEKRDPFRPSPP